MKNTECDKNQLIGYLLKIKRLIDEGESLGYVRGMLDIICEEITTK